MPNFYAHSRFGLDIASEAGLELNNNEPLFRAGCFGPDIFFYHRLLMPGQNARQLGRRMHFQNTDGYIRALLRETVQTDDDNGACFAYLCGYLCHYSLDSVSHPYIYYMAGKGRNHTAFENAVDVALMALDNVPYADFASMCAVNISTDACTRVGAAVARAIFAAYGEHIPDTWFRQALGGMRRARKNHVFCP